LRWAGQLGIFLKIGDHKMEEKSNGLKDFQPKPVIIDFIFLMLIFMLVAMGAFKEAERERP
jgi:hypothetical protein